MKSYVTLEQNVCRVCGKTFDTGSLLLDRRLQEIFEMHTVTGYGNCETCSKQLETHIAMIVVKNTPFGETMKLDEGDRTGEILFLKKEAAGEILNIPVTSDIVFLDEAGAEKLKKLF